MARNILGKASLVAATLWAILGAWDLIKSELLPGRYQSWTLVAKTSHLSWCTWLLALASTLLVVFLEGAHAAMQKRDEANAELQSRMMQETMADQGRTTMNRDWPGDWKLAEDGFRRYANSSVRADWFRDSLGPVERWTLGDDTRDAIHECEALCLQAGRLLVVSPMSSHLSIEVRSHQNDTDRWLYFLKERYGLTNFIIGSSTDNGQTHSSQGGSIRCLASVSARACIECSAKSFPS